MPIRFPDPTHRDDPVGVLLPHWETKYPVGSTWLRAHYRAAADRTLVLIYVVAFILGLLVSLWMLP